MSKVAAYILHGNGLAKRVVPLMIRGAEAYGDQVTIFSDTHYQPSHPQEYDVAILWGYVTTCQNIMKSYVNANKAAVYLDMAYWDRGDCFKVSVNDRHPTAYFQDHTHDDTRRKRFGIEPKEYVKGEHILLAGMGAKAAWAEKREPVESWERAAIEAIRKVTDRRIVYRPKPSWAAAEPIPGTKYNDPKHPIALEGAHAVVCHHSNVAVDGLVEGIPAFVQKGVARPMAFSDLSLIEQPFYPMDREQWLNDVAYCQWSMSEMKSGACWSHLKAEGLIT